MRIPRRAIAATAAAALVPLALVVTAGPASGGDDHGRAVLAPNDGWASADGGTTGGAAADDEHVYRVSTWQEFRDALGGDDARGDTTPRIVYVEGMLDANTTADGERLDCADYADPEYDFDAYLETYDPDGEWGNRDPEGPLEEARERSHDNQDAQVRQYVGSNVTIIGVGENAGITHGSLTVRDSDNVIIRNLHLSNAYDCFPAWDPNDSGGNWNSEFDNLWIATSTHVWVDHNTFDDGDAPPQSLPTYYGQKYEVHDGLLDITNGADLVTSSYNVFREHDKMMLFGSTDNPRLDRGKLRITMHHNLIEDSGQRTPRVRFGEVDVYNNYYVEPDRDGFQYHWGVGVESQIYAENNYFSLADGIEPAEIIHEWRGSQLTDIGTLVNGRGAAHRVDVVAEYNAVNDPDLSDVEWQPTLRTTVHPTQAVPGIVTDKAGAGQLD